jgi:hypothetical protein
MCVEQYSERRVLNIERKDLFLVELPNKNQQFDQSAQHWSRFSGKKVVMDDESFFYLSNFDISGNNKGYYASNVDETPDDTKNTPKLKYEPKLLVWAAISPDGISKSYIAPSG